MDTRFLSILTVKIWVFIDFSQKKINKKKLTTFSEGLKTNIQNSLSLLFKFKKYMQYIEKDYSEFNFNIIKNKLKTSWVRMLQKIKKLLKSESENIVRSLKLKKYRKNLGTF